MEGFEFDRPVGRRSLVGLSFQSRREILQLPGQDDRRKQLKKWRLAAQRLSTAGLWCEENIYFVTNGRLIGREFSEIIHTDQEASDFADLLYQMGTFYRWLPEGKIRHEVPSKGIDADGTFCVLGTTTLLEDRRTKRPKPLPERNLTHHLRLLRYRDRTLETLHKLKKHNTAFKALA